MAKDTKERILAAALEQFSQNGYAGANIRELTASLGLVKSVMYKHFESKEDIWNPWHPGSWGNAACAGISAVGHLWEEQNSGYCCCDFGNRTHWHPSDAQEGN